MQIDEISHLIYAIAIAMIVGMAYYKYTGRDHSWIIIASAYAPDLDAFTNTFLNKLGIDLLVYGQQIRHGDFHNIVVMQHYSSKLTASRFPSGSWCKGSANMSF
jgi:hypothetical protein